MKKILSLLIFSLIITNTVHSETVKEENKIKNTVKSFFSALVQKNIEKESRHFNWENFDWGGGFMGTLLKAGYKKASIEEQSKTKTSFLNSYNNSFLRQRENKLKRKMVMSDFVIISVETISGNKATITYNEPFAKNKKIYLDKGKGTWLIYKIEKAANVK